MARRASDPVQRLRDICLALPEMSERVSHGEPAWFVRGTKTVATLDYLVRLRRNGSAAAPRKDHPSSRRSRRLHSGGRGWLGVRIDNDPDWGEIAQIVEDAYCMVAPKKLIALLDD